MAYQPIENYGIIGNMRSAALVGLHGSIDWFCFPHFDSPSIFAAILDDKKGGGFSINPVNCDDYKAKQFYWPDTNVLITRFLSGEGIVEITDYMPVGADIQEEKDFRIVRRVKGVHGKYQMKMECKPAFNYARDEHELYITEKGAAFHSQNLSIGLASTVPLHENEGCAEATFEVKENDSFVFVLHKIEKGSDCQISYSEEQAEQRFKNTIQFWRNWVKNCTYEGRWREMVIRSALTLKLLTFEPTGAIVAAPTCGLPENVGGERNWDYRYSWIRDASFTIYGLMRIGFTEEAKNFMRWIEKICKDAAEDGSIQIMYGIDGRNDLQEEQLSHLEGYRQSKPVRLGNKAYDQLQLDIYGELMDSVYLYNKYGTPISYDFWKSLTRLIEWVCENWQQKDESIWEVRGNKQDFLYSKVMCWVALDRAIRLADKRSFPSDKERWREVRDIIYEEIMERGWNQKIQAFVQAYDSNILDASNLIMPLVFFVSPTDPRMLKTLQATMQNPDNGGLVTNSLVYRYNVGHNLDGLQGLEGTFNICTFWLVEALTRSGGEDPARLDDARLIFEQMLGYSNHLGIFSEEIGLGGEALGNTPQGFTHLSLISAAFNLDRALG
ncbi:MAG: glycoside hydrolase family 15 protein [Cyclobacteriaceae bacterium]